MVCIAVCAVADYSPISDETASVAEGVCSIGILMYVLFVNVFTAVAELWEVIETANCLPCVSLLGCFMQLLQLDGDWRCRFIYIAGLWSGGKTTRWGKLSRLPPDSPEL